MSEEKKSFSFGFSKVKKPNLGDSAIRDESTKDFIEETDYVKEVTHSGIEGTKKKIVKEELVIPCPGNTVGNIFKKTSEKIEKKEDELLISKDEKDLTDEEKAAKALLEESKRWKENQDDEKNPNDNLVIPANANDYGMVDEKALFEADLDSRPEVSSLEHYDNVPIDGFGMAMLRGMGFKANEGIGGFRKAKIDCIEPVMRPKGLGLGASIPKAKKADSSNKTDNKNEKLVLKKGAFVRIISGNSKDQDGVKLKGQYGEVEGLDEDNARVIVRIRGESISVSENVILLVDHKEYKKMKNTINADQFDEYSKKQKEREKEWKKNEENEETNSRKRHSKNDNYDDDQHQEEDREYSKKSKKSKKSTWVRRGLRVRIVDKRSKYYKEKVIVNDVVSYDQIECVTKSGKVLDNIDPYDVETVIPKEELSIVMIVRGSDFKGKVAELLKTDFKREMIAVRLLPDKEKIEKLSFDDVCEMTGDVADFF